MHKLVNKFAWSVCCVAYFSVCGTTRAAAQELSANTPGGVVANSATGLELEFAKLTSGLNPQLKSTATKEWKILGKLVDGLDAEAQDKELNRITREPQSAWTNRFDELLLEWFVDRLLRVGDFARAERVLAQRCPTYIGLHPIEFELVNDCGPDGVLMLGRAFGAAGTSATAQVLVTSLARGFPSLRVQFPVDREFVAACERWANSPGTNWTLNLDYPYLPSTGLPRTADDPAWKMGLIVAKKKNNAQQVPEH